MARKNRKSTNIRVNETLTLNPPNPERAEQYEWISTRIQESLQELNMFIRQQELEGFTQFNENGERWDFDPVVFRSIVKLSRLMYIQNPLIKRAVEVQCDYVFALGLDFKSENTDIDKVIQDFLSDRENKRALTSYTSIIDREKDLQVDGNLFLTFFVRNYDGRVRVRFFDVQEITDILYNPDDKLDPWLYKRVRTVNNQTIIEYYPDINFNPDSPITPKDLHAEDGTVHWDQPIYHVKPNSVSTMKFGMPEHYSALQWAKAYKAFLEDWATIMRSYARVAMQMSGMSGTGQAAAKSKIEANLKGNTTSPASGNWMFTGSGVELKAVKTAGATTPAEDGKPLMTMVAAGSGMPNTFFGDVDQGNFATAQTLDRPTELKMVRRQKYWNDVLSTILDFVILQAYRATEGPLSSNPAIEYVNELEPGNMTNKVIQFVRYTDPENRPNIKFPTIVERNVTERVRGLVGALTLQGFPINPIWPNKRMAFDLILDALNVADKEDILNEIFGATDGGPIPSPTDQVPQTVKPDPNMLNDKPKPKGKSNA